MNTCVRTTQFCVILLGLLLWFSPVKAQETVLVPYKEGNLYGLATLKGKVVLKPVYSKLRVMGGGCFQYWEVKTTKTNSTDEEDETEKTQTGVLYGTRKIISNTGQGFFTYLKQGLIIGTQNWYQSSNANFYSLQGKPFFAENFISCLIVAPDSDDDSSNVSLGILVKDKDEKTSILVFNSKTKQFTTPLLDKVYAFRAENPGVPRFIMLCSYIDAENNQHKDLIYYNYKLHQHERVSFESDEQVRNIYQLPEVNTSLRKKSMKTPANSEDANQSVRTESFMADANNRITYGNKAMQHTANEKLYLARAGYSQQQPLIFFDGKHYGLFRNEKDRLPHVYDTLLYIIQPNIGRNLPESFLFLAGKKNSNNQFQWGILDANGAVSIPLNFDSIGFGLVELRHNQFNGNNQEGIFTFNKHESWYPPSQIVIYNLLPNMYLVKKDGKYGMLGSSGDILIPVGMDRIWKNGIIYPEIYHLQEQFYAYQQADKYGAFEMSTSGKLKKDTGPVFTHIPTSYYENYMDAEELDIYQVSVPNDLFYGLVHKNGTAYYRK